MGEAGGVDRGAAPPPGSRRSWVENWARAVREVGSVSAGRRAQVLRDIHEGSQPTAVYYVLLGISELIAGFALIIGSDATLIGANVVAPLMTPIFGVSLGLMRGDLGLLRRGLQAEFGGAAFGVALCFLLGSLPIMGEPSAALLAQTRPTLIDLFVAALAGFAGGLAMIDERVSPALPGVAIATALNPPIAAIGLCLASGAYAGAWGAFVLFFANFLAILAVAAALFLIAGFVTREEMGPLRGLARRFAAAALGLLLVTALLTNYLFVLVRNLRTQSAIKLVLDEALSHEPNTALTSVEFTRGGDDGIDVLSTVSAPRVIAPGSVREIQDRLSAQLGEPVRLFVRSIVAKDVSATGSANLRPYLSLDGKVTEAPLAPAMRLLQEAEQLAREVAAIRPGLSFQDIELLEMPTGPVFIVSVETARTPSADDVARLQTAMRQRLDDPSVRVVVRRSLSADITAKGHILLGAAHFGAIDEATATAQAVVEEEVRTGLAALPDLFPLAVDAVRNEGGWTVRAEVVGPRVPAPADVRGVESRASRRAAAAVKLSVWARAEAQVTSDHYEAVGETAD